MAKAAQQKAKPDKIVEIVFPIAGVNKAGGFQRQAPYTTPFALNVRTWDVLAPGTQAATGTRMRGGSRPGLYRSSSWNLSGNATAMGSGNPIQWSDNMQLVFAAASTQAMLLTISNATIYYYNGTDMVSLSGWSNGNASATSLQGAQVGLNYYIADYRSGSILAGTDGSTSGGTTSFTFTSAGTNFHTAGVTTADVIYIAHSTGFIANNPYKTYSTGTITVANGIVTLSGGTGFNSGMIGGTLIFGTYNETIQSVQSTTVLQIADPTAAANAGTSYTIQYSYASEANIFQIASVNASTGVLTINTSQNGQACVMATEGGNTFTWQIGRMPQSITPPAVAPPTGTPSVAAMTYSRGVPPLGCNLCCAFRGRLVLAGPGQAWYMSRVNDPTDWDYGAYTNDANRAVSGSAATTGGLFAPLTAIIPHSDQYMLFASLETVAVLNGDPAYGGQITMLSRAVGCLGPNSWCNMPDSTIMLLGRDGLYEVAAGASGYPEQISRHVLPVDLLNIDPTVNNVNVCYSSRYRSVLISVTPTAGTAGVHYWYDATNGAFWPMTYPNGQQPMVISQYNPNLTGVADQLIFGGFDGYNRVLLDTATTDDSSTAINSYVLLGPLRLGGIGYDGILLHISADIDTASNSFNWSIYTGPNAESIVVNLDSAINGAGTYVAAATGVWSAGTNRRAYCRVPGTAHGIYLSATSPWAIEGIRVLAHSIGETR